VPAIGIAEIEMCFCGIRKRSRQLAKLGDGLIDEYRKDAIRKLEAFRRSSSGSPKKIIPSQQEIPHTTIQ